MNNTETNLPSYNWSQLFQFYCSRLQPTKTLVPGLRIFNWTTLSAPVGERYTHSMMLPLPFVTLRKMCLSMLFLWVSLLYTLNPNDDLTELYDIFYVILLKLAMISRTENLWSINQTISSNKIHKRIYLKNQIILKQCVNMNRWFPYLSWSLKTV